MAGDTKAPGERAPVYEIGRHGSRRLRHDERRGGGGIQGKTRAAMDTIKRLIGGVVDFVKRLPSEMLAWSRRMIEALAQGIRNAIGSVLNGAVDAVRSVLNRLNPFARSSPFLVEQVWAGVKEIGRAYESLKGLSLPAPQQAGAGVATSAAASGPLVINGPLVQVGSLEVRSEEDIRRVSQTQVLGGLRTVCGHG